MLIATRGERDNKKLFYIRYFLAPSPKPNHVPIMSKRNTELIFTVWRHKLSDGQCSNSETLGIAQEAKNSTWCGACGCSESRHSTGSGA